MSKILTLVVLATSALYSEQLAEKQIVTEYVISADDFKKIKNLEDLKGYKGNESVIFNHTATSSNVIKSKNITLLGNDISINAEKTHNEILDILLENSKKITNIDDKKINFLINALRIQESEK